MCAFISSGGQGKKLSGPIGGGGKCPPGEDQVDLFKSLWVKTSLFTNIINTPQHST